MKRFLSVLLAVLMIASLCGCGSSSHSASAPAMAPAMNSGAYYSESYAAEEAMVDYEADYGGFSGTNMKTESAAENDAPDENPEKIIYSADVSMESTEYEKAVAGVLALVKEYGGYIESSSENSQPYSSYSRGYSYGRSASYTIRVPSRYFSDMMGRFSELGNIPYSHTYTENVTAQYYDMQARMEAYETQEQSLLALMEKAESVEDIITIESRLTEVRYAIESMKSTLKNWDRRVSYSTVSLSIEEVTIYTPTEEPSFGIRVKKAFTDGIQSAVEFLQNLVIATLENLPSLIILAVFLALIVWIIRLIIRGLKKLFTRRKAAKVAAKAAKAAKPDEPVFTAEEQKNE